MFVPHRATLSGSTHAPRHRNRLDADDGNRIAGIGLVLGTTSDGEDISLEVTGRNVVISGDPRSGKSWVAGLLCEQLILHGYSVFVVDPEGDYSTLEALPRVSVVGGGEALPNPGEALPVTSFSNAALIPAASAGVTVRSAIAATNSACVRNPCRLRV